MRARRPVNVGDAPHPPRRRVTLRAPRAATNPDGGSPHETHRIAMDPATGIPGRTAPRTPRGAPRAPVSSIAQRALLAHDSGDPRPRLQGAVALKPSHL